MSVKEDRPPGAYYRTGDSIVLRVTTLYRLFNIPDKCPQAELFCLHIYLMKRIKQRIHLGIIYYGDDSGAHAGPCVTAIMRFARLAAAPLHLLPIAEAATILAVEQRHDALIERLVECYKY